MIEWVKDITWVDWCLIFGIPYLFFYFLRIYLKGRAIFKLAKEKYDKLEEDKCKGPHSWVTIPVNGKNSRVCRDCCFSSEHQTFVQKWHLDGELGRIEFLKGLEEYKKVRMRELEKDYCLTSEKLQEITDAVCNIKKDYAIQNIEKRMEEIMGNKGDV